jgi:uncharacterized membrane protein
MWTLKIDVTTKAPPAILTDLSADPLAFIPAHAKPSAMPYQWLPQSNPGEARLRLWPHRSLPRSGFAGFIAATAALLTLPLMTQLGTPALWVLLPFLIAAVGGVWLALQHSYKTGQVTEDLTLTPTQITLKRRNPGGRTQDWQANPHWVQATLHSTGGPVEGYLTLTGNHREVELGAFLTPSERHEIHHCLTQLLAAQHRIPP